jgi:hypothetical protein
VRRQALDLSQVWRTDLRALHRSRRCELGRKRVEILPASARLAEDSHQEWRATAWNVTSSDVPPLVSRNCQQPGVGTVTIEGCVAVPSAVDACWWNHPEPSNLWPVIASGCPRPTPRIHQRILVELFNVAPPVEITARVRCAERNGLAPK